MVIASIEKLKSTSSEDVKEIFIIGDINVSGLLDLSSYMNVTQIFISGTQITNIKGLEFLHELQLLFLGDNQLQEISNISHLSKLTHICLEKKSI